MINLEMRDFDKPHVEKAIVQKDGVSLEDGYEVVKQAFGVYLSRGLSANWESHSESCAPETRALYQIKQFVKQLPGVDQACRVLRSMKLLPQRQSLLSLSALLHPSSPYHNDFMSVYRAILTPPAETAERVVT